ncbi:polyphosphate kinase 1 [Ketobacter sp.]|uniref:polyphosphate kinase 1 n=1 Tax=Ketobacter sp. TaxID=2083498 RepID=UPI000F10ACD4|nr:polyphosphate kinase 1 [Ketobacter sp.]RLU00706.1 MAG: polyphosphate kinase 1 [Ketobacter sp.]
MTTQPPVSTDTTDENTEALTLQIDLGDSAYYTNRYISLLEFNLRVLAQAEDVTLPLMERLKFLLIFSSNMDEFFEVRLAGLQRDIAFNQARPEADGMHPKDVLRVISDKCHAAIERQYKLLNEDLLPLLAQENIHFIARDSWTAPQVQWIKHYFRQQVAPVLTPIGLDLAHPFPRLVNKSLNFLVTLEGNDAFGRKLGMAVVPAPKSLPRIIRLPDDVCEGGDNFIFLSSIIHYHAGYLFPGMKSTGCYQFRLTRNSDLFLDEEKVEDLSTALRGELYSRRYGEEVRLEVADNMPEELIEFLLNKFGLDQTQLYRVNGPVNLTRMMSVLDVAKPQHEFSSFKPKLPGDLQRSDRMFAAITSGDILLNHPYQSFQPVIYFLKQAARDPDVVAIKQTLYRTGTNSEILDLLVEAARNGKEVTAVVELRARFDEESNLEIAARLQEAGVVVVYGIVGHKTHAKMMLVVRREGAKLKRYVHLGTGNYHAGNARLYSDYSLLTCNEELAEDVHKIFQELTGMGRPAKLRHLYHSPFTLQQELLVQHIRQERDNALNGLPAKIIFKCNSLTDKEIIEELYRASQAGVEIRLIVRGICCLLPGIPGVSENIEVRSIVGRFLEHTRVYYFHRNGDYAIYLASADLMERNLYRRVEISFPIIDEKLRARAYKEGLEIYLKDNCQAWIMNPDGTYTRQQPQDGEERLSAQAYLVEKLG